jgi:hypothetical protein
MTDTAKRKTEEVEAAHARVKELEAKLAEEEGHAKEGAAEEGAGGAGAEAGAEEMIAAGAKEVIDVDAEAVVEVEAEAMVAVEVEEVVEVGVEEAVALEEEVRGEVGDRRLSPSSWNVLDGRWDSSVNGQPLVICGHTVTFDEESQSQQSQKTQKVLSVKSQSQKTQKVLSVDWEGTIRLPSRQGGWWVAVENAKEKGLEQLHFSRAGDATNVIVWTKQVRVCVPQAFCCCC